MSVFENVSGVDRELVVDGRRQVVAAGATVEVADGFDYQLIEQVETWKFSKKRAAVAVTPAVPESKPAEAVTEGDN